jgi:hypothetical protein
MMMMEIYKWEEKQQQKEILSLCYKSKQLSTIEIKIVLNH